MLNYHACLILTEPNIYSVTKRLLFLTDEFNIGGFYHIKLLFILILRKISEEMGPTYWPRFNL